jgi:protein-tyrosine phosphatase
VLVTCGAGCSRSPVFAAAYLHEEGEALPAAFTGMMRRRPQILPHPVLLRSLVECYQLPTTGEALLVDLVRRRREIAADRP